jgi:hypothetical protein
MLRLPTFHLVIASLAALTLLTLTAPIRADEREFQAILQATRVERGALHHELGTRFTFAGSEGYGTIGEFSAEGSWYLTSIRIIHSAEVTLTDDEGNEISITLDEIQLSSDATFVTGFHIVGGTGVFEGATGSGKVSGVVVLTPELDFSGVICVQ